MTDVWEWILPLAFPLDVLQRVAGPVAQISYAVDPVTISPGTYADLNPQAIDVLDTGSLPLSVTPQPGRIDLTPYCEGDFESDGDVDADGSYTLSC